MKPLSGFAGSMDMYHFKMIPVKLRYFKQHSYKEIAEKLYNSEETIKKHIYNMFIKMNVKNRLSLVTRAKEEGILK